MNEVMIYGLVFVLGVALGYIVKAIRAGKKKESALPMEVTYMGRLMSALEMVGKTNEKGFEELGGASWQPGTIWLSSVEYTANATTLYFMQTKDEIWQTDWESADFDVFVKEADEYNRQDSIEHYQYLSDDCQKKAEKYKKKAEELLAVST